MPTAIQGPHPTSDEFDRSSLCRKIPSRIQADSEQASEPSKALWMSDSETVAHNRRRQVDSPEASTAVSSRDKEMAGNPQHNGTYQRASSRSVPNHRTSPDGTKIPQERRGAHPSLLPNHSVDGQGPEVPVSGSGELSVKGLCSAHPNPAGQTFDLNSLYGSARTERPVVSGAHA